MRLFANLLFAAAVTAAGFVVANDINGDVLDTVNIALAPCTFVMWFCYLTAITWLERVIISRGRKNWLTKTRVAALISALMVTGSCFAVVMPLSLLDLPLAGLNLAEGELVSVQLVGWLIGNYCTLLLLYLAVIAAMAASAPRQATPLSGQPTLQDAESTPPSAKATAVQEGRMVRQTVGTDIGVVTGVVGAVEIINKDLAQAGIAVGIGLGCLIVLHLVSWYRARVTV